MQTQLLFKAKSIKMDCDAKTDMFQIKRLKNGINPDCKTSERSTKNISKNMLKFSQKLQEQ